MIRAFVAFALGLGVLAGCAGLDPRDAPGKGIQSPKHPGAPADEAP